MPKPDSYHHGDLKAALLTAAEAELAESGVEAFSLRKVARRAGVSHAAPAHHFGDVTGLLTALATEGFRRLVAFQDRRQAGLDDPAARLVASGHGYVEFALAHTALFRLIFASDRPDHESPGFEDAAGAAYGKLVEDSCAATGRDPESPEAMADVAAFWALAHGFADLLSAGRLKAVQALPETAREAMVATLFRRVLDAVEDTGTSG